MSPKESEKTGTKDVFTSDKKETKKKMSLNSPIFNANLKNEKFAIDSIDPLLNKFSLKLIFKNFFYYHRNLSPYLFSDNYDINSQFVRKYEEYQKIF